MSALRDPAGADFRHQRRLLLMQSSEVMGLDYVATETDLVFQRAAVANEPPRFRLLLHFVPAPPESRAVPNMTRANIMLRSPDGRRIDGVRPEALELPKDPAGTTATLTLQVADDHEARDLTRDPRACTLELVGMPGVDRFFASAPFSFAAGVVRRQLAPPEIPKPPGHEAPEVDYLAKDYQSFRTLMLDRMAFHIPDWQERNPADLGVAILEVLAYAADYLSYYQDATATEAYLQTARRRISVRRLGRLVDYYLGEGCNSRVWVHVKVARPPREAHDPPDSDPLVLPQGSQLLTRAGELPPAIVFGSVEYEQALTDGARVFETAIEQRLYARQNRMPIYTWGTSDFTLPEGATSAALAGHHRHLRAGDLVCFEQVRSPVTGRRQEADPELRHIVRLAAPPTPSEDPVNQQEPGAPLTTIRWFDEDALPFPLTVAARVWRQDLAVARGNMVLADQGRTVIEDLPQVGDPRRYRPQLEQIDLTFRVPPDPDRLRDQPARGNLEQDPARALPAVALVETSEPCLRTAGVEATDFLLSCLPAGEGDTWLPRPDLLESDRFGRNFVVEMDEGRQAHLRFGDGRYGREPATGGRFLAYYRVGNGPAGNVGHDSIAHVVTGDARIAGARNPLPSSGGSRWEKLEPARLQIPRAFHSQRRCVTESDFVTAAERLPEVLKAVAQLRWTGSWTTAFVYLQRSGGRPIDESFAARVERSLEPLLVTGYDLALRPPGWAALEIALRVALDSSHRRTVIHQLTDSFSDQRLPDGRTGFFYPDNLTFGQPVYLSDLIERATQVPGVREVVAETFRRLDGVGVAALERGYVEVGEREIAMLCNDPQAPQLGTIEFHIEGGQ